MSLDVAIVVGRVFVLGGIIDLGEDFRFIDVCGELSSHLLLC